MARLKRIQFPGGIYHVMSRGNRKGIIFENDDDRLHFLSTVQTAIERYGIRLYEFCLMGTHYHLLLDTPRGNLAEAMCFINGVFAQSSNWRHNRTGHLLGERYKSIVVPRELYLKRASRYIVLNPVKPGTVPNPADWPWSSYRATAGLDSGPAYLYHDWLDWAFDTNDRRQAQKIYRAYVAEGIGTDVGDEEIIFGELAELTRARYRDRVVPHTRAERVRPPIDEVLSAVDRPWRSQTIRILEAHAVHGYRLSEIARVLKVHPSTPGTILRRHREATRSRKAAS